MNSNSTATRSAKIVDEAGAQSVERFRGDYGCLQRLFDHASDAILVHCLDGHITDVNVAGCETLGYTRGELLGMFPWDLAVQNSREKMQSLWTQMPGGTPITVGDELRRKDGTLFPVEVRLVRYRADHREVIIETCRNITKRREAETSLVKAEADLKEERNRMAREIHDTLAQGFAGILLQLEAADAAAEAGLCADNYISRVRDIARFGLGEARRSVLALRPLVLEEKGLEHALRQLAERSSVEGAIICEMTATGSLRRLDSAVELGLFRIAQEAVGNAVKHAKATRISIELMVAAGTVKLAVIDNGRGLDTSSDASAEKGYGLLTMSERAQKIAGHLDIQDVTGGGTRVVVSASPPMAGT